MEKSPETMDISGNPIMNMDDLTKYMFRQKVQELIFIAKKTDDIQVHKKTLKEFFLSMKAYVETNRFNDDIFWKVLLDDIYIVYKTMGKSYAHMYTTTRQVSQGREYSCNTEDITDDDHDNIQPPMLSRQTNFPETFWFTQPDIPDDNIDATIKYNDICYDVDEDDDILNHRVTLTRETTIHSTQQMNDIIDFIRNQDV